MKGARPVATTVSAVFVSGKRPARATRPEPRFGDNRCLGPQRPGVALVLVLLVICITLALSYAAVRSQFTALRIQHNARRGISAREAAVTGLAMAIKKMHTTGWNGVGTTLTGSLGGRASFQVTYTAGDPALKPGDADYADFPYRVTLTSTGSSADPDNPAAIATHRIRAVLRLAPRALAAEPSDWSTMQNYTVYQANSYSLEVDIPARIEGPVRIQGKLLIAPHYPNDANARTCYLEHLSAMRTAGYPDYRPLGGPVDLAFAVQDSLNYDALTNRLHVTAVNVPVREAAADWVKPSSLASYQIYEGGPVYAIPFVDGTLQDVSLGPDPLTNPLGIYYRDTTITLKGNVTIRGSLYCRDDIKIDGAKVSLQPIELPALHGSTAPVRLPVASCRCFFVTPNAGGSLTGLLAVFDRVEIQKSPETVAFTITGRVIAPRLFIKERQPWETLNWGSYYYAFLSQLVGPAPVLYFPVWMGQQGRDPKPLLTIKPDSGPISYHWHYPGNRIYEPHPDDDGLRWDLREWTENP
jgi:hypothetical protein